MLISFSVFEPEVEIVLGGERGDHDGGGLPSGPSRQPLEQLLRDVGHEAGNEPEPGVQTRVQHVTCRQNGAGVRALEDRLQILEVDVAQLVQPEVVERCGGRREIVRLQTEIRWSSVFKTFFFQVFKIQANFFSF